MEWMEGLDIEVGGGWHWRCLGGRLVSVARAYPAETMYGLKKRSCSAYAFNRAAVAYKDEEGYGFDLFCALCLEM